MLFPLTDGSTKEVAAASKPIQRTSMFYSRSEDEKILAYIAKNRRFSDTGGNLLWKTMEERNIVPDRLKYLQFKGSHSAVWRIQEYVFDNSITVYIFLRKGNFTAKSNRQPAIHNPSERSMRI